jgi:hypothetical protein
MLERTIQWSSTEPTSSKQISSHPVYDKLNFFQLNSTSATSTAIVMANVFFILPPPWSGCQRRTCTANQLRLPFWKPWHLPIVVETFQDPHPAESIPYDSSFTVALQVICCLLPASSQVANILKMY